MAREAALQRLAEGHNAVAPTPGGGQVCIAALTPAYICDTYFSVSGCLGAALSLISACLDGWAQFVLKVFGLLVKEPMW